MDKIKFFIDEDVHAALSAILKKRGFDVVHAQEVNRKGKADKEQLKYAANQHRCLMSFNVKDYVLLHNNYIQQGEEHFGIIVSKQLPLGETLKRLLNLLQHTSNMSIKNKILFLSGENR